GRSIPIYASFYHARRGNGTQQWPCSIVDVATGITEARNLNRRYVLPDWEAGVRMALRAHSLCTNFVFVGWDIALTSEGPMILEGNKNWSAGDFQSVAKRPIGTTRFPEILEQQLVQANLFSGYSA